MKKSIPKGLDKLGLKNIGKVYYNLNYDELQAHEVNLGECKLSTSGAAICETGIFTGRSPKDKYFVDQEASRKYLALGEINRTIDPEIFKELFELSLEQLSNKNIYIVDCYCGSSLASRRKVRFITEVAWQAHFVTNMFIRPKKEDLVDFEPDFTVYNACKTTNKNYKEHGLHSDVFVAFDIENSISIIGGTWYGGEMKKGIFSMMNY